MPIDASMQASHRAAIKRRGVPVTFRRITGTAPNTAKVDASVTASITAYQPDRADPARAGYASDSIGAITQGLRLVLVMADELAAAGFPLPVKKHDKIVVTDPGAADTLDIVAVDPFKRSIAGAIELVAAGVQ